MKQIDFDTRQYEFSHGAKPRGRGSWAFEIREGDEEIGWFQGTYSEAKKQAKAWAQEKALTAGYAGELTIEVLP